MAIKLKTPATNTTPNTIPPETPSAPATAPATAPVAIKDLLPTVTITGDLDALMAALQDGPHAPALLLDVALYLSRLHKVLEPLSAIEATARDLLLAHFRETPQDKREPVRSRAGTASYTPEGVRESAKDRDAIVEILNPEQLRASYKPDLGALKIMLKPAVYAQLVKEDPTSDRITLRDVGGQFDGF